MEEFPYLYRYMRLDPARCAEDAEQLVSYSKVILASSAHFNDPFDPAPRISFDGSIDDLKSYIGRMSKSNGQSSRDTKILLKTAIQNWKNTLYRKEAESKIEANMLGDFHNLGMYCFSRKHDHPLMWSHYADHHRGIVVRFNLNASPQAFAARALPVSYQQDRPLIRALTDDDQSRFRKALLIKSSLWEYEQEWRFISMELSPGPCHIDESDVDAIYFGARCPDHHQRLVWQWASKRKTPISFFKGKVAKSTFDISFSKQERVP